MSIDVVTLFAFEYPGNRKYPRVLKRHQASLSVNKRRQVSSSIIERRQAL